MTMERERKGKTAKRRPRADRRALPCKDKTRYHGKEQAIHALHGIQSRGDKRDRMPVRAYYCDPEDIWEDIHEPDGVEGRPGGCGGWHLTSQETPR